MITADPIDFLTKPDSHHSLSDYVLRRHDLSMLRKIAATDNGVREHGADTPSAVIRLQAAGLLSFDGETWIVTALGKESVRQSASCRDGSEGLRRPPAYYRARREDIANPPPPDGDLVGAIVEHERRLYTSRCQPVEAAIAEAMDALSVAMSDTPPVNGLRVAVITRRPGRLERAVGAVGRFARCHVGGVVIAVAMVLAGLEWAANEPRE